MEGRKWDKALKRGIQKWTLGASILVLIAGTYHSSRSLEAMQKGYAVLEDPLYLPSGAYLHILAMDFDGLLADFLWIRGAIYFGSHYRMKKFQYPWLYHILNLATDLDPHYHDVYWYGSSIVPTVEASNRLLEKGMRYFPKEWRFPEMIGFNYHHYKKDYLSAGRYYELASKLPGHPPFVPSLAGRFYTEAGEMDSAIRVLKNFYDTTQREDLKKDFGRRIRQLVDLKELGEAVAAFRNRFGRDPNELSELKETGILERIPEEPFGGVYYMDPKTRRVRSSTDPWVRRNRESDKNPGSREGELWQDP